MNNATHLLYYQLGLLHLTHILLNADRRMDERKKKAVLELQQDEQISKWVIDDFHERIHLKSEREIFQQGVEYLNQCNKEEKLVALAHLYHLVEADKALSMNEVRLLLYSLNVNDTEFKDVELAARMVSAAKKCA